MIMVLDLKYKQIVNLLLMEFSGVKAVLQSIEYLHKYDLLLHNFFVYRWGIRFSWEKKIVHNFQQFAGRLRVQNYFCV